MAQRRSELTLFRLFGAPVLVHWTVLLIVLLALLFSRDPLVLSAGFAAYLSLILVHEIGHACIARLNRLRVHELLVFPLHGWCRYQAGRTRGQDIAVAWGGVAAQAVLFAVAVALSILAPNPGGRFGPALAAIGVGPAEPVEHRGQSAADRAVRRTHGLGRAAVGAATHPRVAARAVQGARDQAAAGRRGEEKHERESGFAERATQTPLRRQRRVCERHRRSPNARP
jgi:hypothetical protein